MAEKYDIFILGYDRNLNKTDSFYDDGLPINIIDGVNPILLGSGDLAGNISLEGGYMQSSNFVTGTSGWQLTPDSAELNVSTAILALDIPDTTTDNSFHVNSDGNTWWGCNVADFATPSNANAYILSTGAAVFQDVAVTGTISGRSTSTVASAINATGNFIDSNLNTSSRDILAGFDFGTTNYAGALKSGDIAWNTTTGAITSGSGVVVYRKGIVGAASGVTTFSIDAATGDATFAGTIGASTITGDIDLWDENNITFYDDSGVNARGSIHGFDEGLAIASLNESIVLTCHTNKSIYLGSGDDAQIHVTSAGIEMGLDVSSAVIFRVDSGGIDIGGTMDMNTNKIIGLGAPSADTDASTKKYVDDNVSTYTDADARGAINDVIGSDGHLDATLDCDGYDIIDVDLLTVDEITMLASPYKIAGSYTSIEFETSASSSGGITITGAANGTTVSGPLKLNSYLKLYSHNGTPGTASSYTGYLYYDTGETTLVFSNGSDWYKVTAEKIV